MAQAIKISTILGCLLIVGVAWGLNHLLLSKSVSQKASVTVPPAPVAEKLPALKQNSIVRKTVFDESPEAVAYTESGVGDLEEVAVEEEVVTD